MTSYRQHNLTANIGGTAPNTDINLLKPWGIVVLKDGTILVANSNSNRISRYDKHGVFISSVTVGQAGLQNPTGIVDASCGNFNTDIIVVTLQGTIETYQLSSSPTTTTNVYTSTTGGVYTGVTIYKGTLYVANFASGTVDAFTYGSPMYTPVPDKQIADNALSAVHYYPFNVYTHKNEMYISFALSSTDSVSVINGLGNGYVDIYKKKELSRLINRGPLDAPWGMIRYKNTLYVANPGGGYISVFKITRNNRKDSCYVSCSRYNAEYCKPITTCYRHTLYIDSVIGIVDKGECGCDDKNTIYFTSAPQRQTTTTVPPTVVSDGILGELIECDRGCNTYC